MKQMNNFELHEKTLELYDTYTGGKLARLLIEASVLLKEASYDCSNYDTGSKIERFLTYHNLK